MTDTAQLAVVPADTKALADVFRPEPWEGERVPHGAQQLANCYGCFEGLAHHLRRAYQTLDNPEVKKALEAIEPDAEKVARQLAADFARLYPDLEPLLPESQTKALEPPDPASDAGKALNPLARLIQPRTTPVSTAATTTPTPATGKKAEETAPTKPEDDRTEQREEDKVGVDELKSCAKDAAEFLEQHAEHPGLADDATAKAACRYHAKMLGDHCKGMDEDDEASMSEEEKALAKSLIERMTAECDENEKLLQQLAG